MNTGNIKPKSHVRQVLEKYHKACDRVVEKTELSELELCHIILETGCQLIDKYEQKPYAIFDREEILYEPSFGYWQWFKLNAWMPMLELFQEDCRFFGMEHTGSHFKRWMQNDIETNDIRIRDLQSFLQDKYNIDY